MKNILIYLVAVIGLNACNKSDDNPDSQIPQIVNQSMTVNPSGFNPLSAIVYVTTDIPTTYTITIKGQDNNDLIHFFDGATQKHVIPVLGLYANYLNSVQIEFVTPSGQSIKMEKTIKTAPLMGGMPQLDIITANQDDISDGFIMMHLASTNGLSGVVGYNVMIDSYGKVRWHYSAGINHIFKQLQNGNYMIDAGGSLVEIDLLGVAQSYYTTDKDIHHDMVEMPNGNLLYLTAGQGGTVEDGVAELDRETKIVIRRWDMKDIIDANRIEIPLDPDIRCWFHANGLAYDETDDSFIVSGRSQSAVVKVDRKSGKLMWILGNHNGWTDQYKPYLFNPIDANFEWQWAQHAPNINPWDKNRILLFDNGCAERTTPHLTATQNYSRAVEYHIDPVGHAIEQSWQWGKERGPKLYSSYISNATYCSKDNILICFGGILRDANGNATNMAFGDIAKNVTHIVEVNKVTNEVVLEIAIDGGDDVHSGARSYRAYKTQLY